MKPTVLTNPSSGGGGGGAAPNSSNGSTSTNGVNIPINHEYGNATQYHQPGAGGYYGDNSFGSPRQQQQPQHHPQPQQQPHHPQYQQHAQQNPAHHQQGFGFEPDMDMDMDMDMFPRSRMGRMHDPFAGFSGSHFGFPQFGSLGRRRQPAAADHDDDFFNRLPSEFRQYIPETFGHRRSGSAQVPSTPQQPQQPQQYHPQQQQKQMPPQGQYYQNYVPAGTPPYSSMPQSPSKKLCDAAIQTEDPIAAGGYNDAVDGNMQYDNLKQHGFRNTVDMGVKSPQEGEDHISRAHSAPPPEQLQQQQYYQNKQIPVNGKRPTPPPQQQQHGGNPHFGTQTSPQAPTTGGAQQQQPHFQKVYYPPQQQPHPQQKQQTPPPPQTPGGTYIRTIPIFVEGRSEPIINSHKEIPNQNAGSNASANATANASAKAFTPHQQPHHRPTPLNTQFEPQQEQQQQQQPAGPAGMPPQTPHTLDSINKIQDIQRDVLDLMSKVENFGGKRQDKEYAYLDEMLTRNLLKLDTIDTNGKDSIRLARKEAIKCIQASINVLEAKAEENLRAAQAGTGYAQNSTGSGDGEESAPAAEAATFTQKSGSNNEVTKDNIEEAASGETLTAEPIPLPPPEGMQAADQSTEEADRAEQQQKSQKEVSPEKSAETATAAGIATEGQINVETK